MRGLCSHYKSYVNHSACDLPWLDIIPVDETGYWPRFLCGERRALVWMIRCGSSLRSVTSERKCADLGGNHWGSERRE